MTDAARGTILVDTTTGTLTAHGRTYQAALGRGGSKPAEAKKEGDGATPLGCAPLRLWPTLTSPPRLDGIGP